MAPLGAQPRPEDQQDGGGEGIGGAATGSVKLGPTAPRGSAHGRAALLPPPPPALRPSPPPAARRALHYPARRPPSFVATTSAGERRARRRTLALCAGERKCSEAEPAGRNGRCPGQRRLSGSARGARGSSWALGRASARSLHTHQAPGVEARRSPSPATHSLQAAWELICGDRHSHGRVPESPGLPLHSSGSLSRPAAVTISWDDAGRSSCACQRPPPRRNPPLQTPALAASLVFRGPVLQNSVLARSVFRSPVCHDRVRFRGDSSRKGS